MDRVSHSTRGRAASRLAVLLGTAALAACGGGSGGGSNESAADDVPGLTVLGFGGAGAGDATSAWLVNTSYFRLASFTPGSGDGFVDLVSYRDDFPVSRHVAFYTPNLDACDLRRRDDGGGDDGGGGDRPPLVSGGPQVFLDSGGEPFFTFALSPDDEGVNYDTNNGIPGPIPADATLTIPGDVFPALTAYELPDEPPVPERLLPDTSAPITSGSEYSWLPGDANDFVELAFLAYDANDDFVDFAIVCAAVDDGSFTLPADALAEIDAIEDRLVLRYSRVRQQLERVGDIIVRARTIVAE